MKNMRNVNVHMDWSPPLVHLGTCIIWFNANDIQSITRLVTLKPFSRLAESPYVRHIWYIWIHEGLLSVCFRRVVGFLSVWVRDCRFDVGYVSSTLVIIGLESVSCRLSIGLRFNPASCPQITPTWARLFYCVGLQHCRWPMAVVFN